MIEGVEGFKAKLELGALGDVDVLVEAEDEVFNAWHVDNVALPRSQTSPVGGREESHILGNDSAVEGPFQLLGIADLIATVNAKASRYIQESAYITRSRRRNRSTEWTWESPAGR